MKVGQIFNLPENVHYLPGHIGKVRAEGDKKRIISKYEVVEIGGELKGRVIVTYGNRRSKAV